MLTNMIVELQFALLFGLLIAADAQLNFRMKHLRVEKCGPCPSADSNAIRLMNFTNKQATRGIFLINSDIVVSRNVTGPLSFQMKIMKCTEDGTSCDHYDTLKAGDVCGKMKQTNPLWSNYVNAISPPMQCPIQKGDYQMVNASYDLTLASHMPIDGFRWLSYVKMFEKLDPADGSARGKSKYVQVFCLDSDVRITAGGSSRKRT